MSFVGSRNGGTESSSIIQFYYSAKTHTSKFDGSDGSIVSADLRLRGSPSAVETEMC